MAASDIAGEAGRGQPEHGPLHQQRPPPSIERAITCFGAGRWWSRPLSGAPVNRDRREQEQTSPIRNCCQPRITASIGSRFKPCRSQAGRNWRCWIELKKPSAIKVSEPDLGPGTTADDVLHTAPLHGSVAAGLMIKEGCGSMLESYGSQRCPGGRSGLDSPFPAWARVCGRLCRSSGMQSRARGHHQPIPETMIDWTVAPAMHELGACASGC